MTAQEDAIVAEILSHLKAESAQDLDTLLEGMTEDCFNLVVPDPHQLYAGPDEVARRYRGLWTTFPDLKVEMRRVVSVSDTIAVTEHTLSGTQDGPLFGFPPSGKHVEVETAVIWEIVDGRIKGETVYFDVATMLRQAGHLS